MTIDDWLGMPIDPLKVTVLDPRVVPKSVPVIVTSIWNSSVAGSPIRPFKGNLEHQNMFEVSWGFGIEKLSPDELSDSTCALSVGFPGREKSICTRL